METSKSAGLLAHEHQSDHKNVTNDLRIIFLLCICSRKKDAANGMPENVASGRILTKMAALVFHRI